MSPAPVAPAGEAFRDDARAARRRLTPEALAPFTVVENGRAARSVAATLAGLGAGLAVGAWLLQTGSVAGWLALALVVPFVATRQHALFVLAHDAAHYRLFSHRGVNDAVGRTLGALGGLSMCTYRVTHRLHHNHLYGREDPDVALNGGYPRGRAYLLRKLLVDLSGRTAPKTFAYFFGAPAINDDVRDALRPLDDTSPALRAAARADRWWVAAVQAALPVLAWGVGGGAGLLAWAVLWALPMLTVLQAILRLRAVAEHGAPAGYASPLQAARTNLLDPGLAGWLERLVLFPHHVNFHVEHHLYPAVPHTRLPAFHAHLAELGMLEGAEVRRFSETLRRVFAARGSIPEAIPPRARAHAAAAAAPVPGRAATLHQETER